MKNQELRSSLIKSGVILILCVFFIYSFAFGDSGGVTGTIASIFSGILFLFGLIISVAISVALMFGIYFGILYMYDQDTCKNTYGEFKGKISDLSHGLCTSCGHKCVTRKTTPLVPLNDEDLSPLRDNQKRLDSQLTSIQSSVSSIEQILGKVSASALASADDLTVLNEKSKSIEEALQGKATADSIDEATKKLGSDITAMQGSIKPLADKLALLETTLSSLETEESTNNEAQQTIDKSIGAIKEELASMNSAIENLNSVSASASQNRGATEEDKSEHRILSYFTKKADKNKFITLVQKSVEKEMTYAEVGEFLNDSVSAEASEVLSDHPSLTKDFIRIYRQKI